MEKMTRYNMLPKTSRAGNEAGASAIVPPKYIKREVVKGALRPVGPFRGPLPTRANASTLHLFGPRLSSFADWQVRSIRMRCSSASRDPTTCVRGQRILLPLAPNGDTGLVPSYSLRFGLLSLVGMAHGHACTRMGVCARVQQPNETCPYSALTGGGHQGRALGCVC